MRKIRDRPAQCSNIWKCFIASLVICASYILLFKNIGVTRSIRSLKKNDSVRLPGTKSIVVLIPFMGILPNYTDYFINSIANKSIDVYFISVENTTLLSKSYPNINQIFLDIPFADYVAHRLCNLYECNQIEENRVKQDINDRLKRPYNLCELRPMLAYVFKEHLEEYSYIGWTDPDTIWNNPSLLKDYLDLNYDIITVGADDLERLFVRGQFTLFKNEFRVTTAFLGLFDKSSFFRHWEQNTFLNEEGMFSKFVFTSDLAILMVPFQQTQLMCNQVSKKDGKLQCLLSPEVPQIQNFAIHKSSTVELQIPGVTPENCSTDWISLDYRLCLDYRPNLSFISIKENLATVYPLTEEEILSIKRFPLFYHFQFEKSSFRLIQEK